MTDSALSSPAAPAATLDVTLDGIEDEDVAQHLLLIGDSKTGKSTYVAQAAIDGWLVLYIDGDNGMTAIRHATRNKPEARKNIIPIRTNNPYECVNGLLTGAPFRWNMTQDCAFSSGSAKKDDVLIQINGPKIPNGVILAIDSWTTVALDAMELGAEKGSVRLEDISGTQAMQGVYGDANLKLTVLCAILQRCKFHVVVQAHGTTFEKYDKPLGSQESVKQKQMTLREIMDVPSSSSRPHGQLMVKYFNQVGWLVMSRADVVELDFTRKHGRVGGGTPNKKGPVEDMSFTKLFGPVPERPSIDSSWFEKITTEEFLARRSRNQETKSAGTPSPAIAAPAEKVGFFKKK